MRIRAIALNQFKKFTTPVGLEGIGDGLNVVVGPNEMGKSTLLDALRAALFEKHGSKAQPIVALQNERNQAAPVVELAFEVGAGAYRIRKRFVKKPYARLFCADGRTLEGDEAEDTLRGLLGFDEPGKAGAKPESLGMWSVLWVRQGRSFGALELPESARSSLHSALESEVGEVLGGRGARALPEAVERQLGELVTATGRPRGPYKALLEEVEALEAELEGLRGRRRELSDTLEALEAAEETLARLSSEEREDADREALEAARARQGELERLESRIGAARTEVELKQAGLQQAERARAGRRELKARIEAEAQAVEAARRAREEVRAAERGLQERLQALRGDVKAAEEAVTSADGSASRARRVLAAVQRAARIRELEARLQRARQAEDRRRAAQKALAAIPVTEQKVQAVRAAAKALDAARARLAAAATRIAFDMPADRLARLEVDGAPLEAGQGAVQAIEAVTIRIPDYGRISVQPAIQDRDGLLAGEREAGAALEAALEACGVASADAAEARLAERERHLRDAELARQEVALLAPAMDDHDAGVEPLADHVEGLGTALERERAELGLDALPAGQEAERAVAEAQDAAGDARERLAAARASLQGPEEELGRIRTELGGVSARYEDGNARLERLQGELAEAEAGGSEEDLESAVAAAAQALAERERVVAELEGRRGGETLEQLAARVRRLEQALRDRQHKRAELKERVAGLRSRIEAFEGAGLDEAIQRKVRELEQAAARRWRLEREVAVLTLLRQTLRAAEREAKERYLSPVLRRVRPYLQILFPGAEITIDENLHVTGVVREGGHEEAFERLSMGTQEQIAVLVRLAFAEMLVEQGHPATVVLDDALVFSDDRRMGRMFDILNMVGQRVQILVLTCREQLFEGAGGRHLALADVPGTDLESA